MNSSLLWILLLAVVGLFLTPIYGDIKCTTSATRDCLEVKECLEDHDGITMKTTECKPKHGKDTVCCFWNKKA